MITEPLLVDRISEFCEGWGWACKFLFGPYSPDLANLVIEGARRKQQTMAGYELDTENFTISLPNAKIGGERDLLFRLTISPQDRYNYERWACMYLEVLRIIGMYRVSPTGISGIP